MNPSSAPGLLRRLAAIGYDSFLLFALAFASNALLILARVAVEGADAIHRGERALGGAWEIPAFLLPLLAAAAFYLYCWKQGGQTLGMRAWGFRIESNDGTPITLRQGVIRLAVAPISTACFGVGHLFCWHDRISKTRLRMVNA